MSERIHLQMAKKMITVSGLTFSKILNEVNREGFNMIKKPIAEAGKMAQKRAKDIAPVISGTFRKSIIRRTRARRKEGEISATVGVNSSSPAIKYAWKVENKYAIFQILDKQMRIPTQKLVAEGIRKGMQHLKVRK